ncbi:MAG: TraR/DksA C4-type zinc finger protein [Ferruginibacter sp.]
MATKKKAVKPAAKKPAPKKAVASKPVKKASPAKKVAKPVAKKATRPVAKKPAAKTAKPVAKSKLIAKKPLIKKASVKAVTPAKKPLAKNTKPVQKAAPKKPVAVQKPAHKPMTKKTEEKKPTQKPVVAAKAPVAAAKPIAKPVQKPMATNTKDIRVTPAKPVVIPKFNTKTSRKYQPDFTKSVLDQPKNDPGAPIVRYNDADLKEFKELINRKLDAAKKELSYLQGLITRKDEMGGDESDNRYMTMEDGSLSMEREQLSQMASRQITFIDHLEKALMRIENKTYGICRITGKLIDKARLRAVPHATLSIEAKMGIVK